LKDLDEFIKLADYNLNTFKDCNKESYHFINSTLSYFWDYLLNIGQINVNDFPKFTINLFIGSNFDLLLQAFYLLMSGYFRPSLILLRPVYESVALCMYFCEFPEKEKKYRLSKNKVNWLKEQKYIRGIIEKIEKQGKIFNTAQQAGFLSNLIANPLKEINSFIHFDHEYIFTSISAENNNLILGPKKISEEQKNGLIICLLESCLFSLIVMEKSIKLHSSQFIELAKEITDHIIKLRKRNKELLEGTKNAGTNS
jgi:hypothetical protein